MTLLMTERPGYQVVNTQSRNDFVTLDVSAVAELSDDSIRSMNQQEMARVVRAVKAQHLRPGVAETLANYAPEMLRKLVFLARRWCRHQQTLRQ